MALTTFFDDAYLKRFEGIAQAVSAEMGVPRALAHDAQVSAGRGHLESTIQAFENYSFSERRGTTMVV